MNLRFQQVSVGPSKHLFGTKVTKKIKKEVNLLAVMSVLGRPSAAEDFDDLTIGCHVAYLYEFSTEKQTRLFRFVSKALLDSNNFVLYICGKQGTKGIRLSMKDSGLDVAGWERANRLRIVDSEEFYLTSAKRPQFKSLNELQSQFGSFAASGNNMVIFSEMDALVRKGFFEDYKTLELTLGKNITFFKAIFICAYDKRELIAAGVSSPLEDLGLLHSTVFQ